MIDSTTWRPMPAEPETPWALQPPAITKPFTLALGPTMKRPSGVNVGHPLKTLRTPRFSIDRRRLVADRKVPRVGRHRARLPAAAEEGVDLRSEVKRRVGDADDRQVRLQPFGMHRDEVFVSHGNDRQVEADAAGDVIGVGASGIDDHIAFNHAMIGVDAADLAILHDDALDSGLRLESRAEASRVGDV
jgi:hypothetical protein